MEARKALQPPQSCAFGTHEPLGECRFLHQEGAGDLDDREPTDEAQGQGRARIGRYCRVAADENQA